MFTHSFQRYIELDRIDLSAIEPREFIRKLIPMINLLVGINIKPVMPDYPIHAKWRARSPRGSVDQPEPQLRGSHTRKRRSDDQA